MRQSQTAILERYTVLRGEFATEPYEAGWAGEARWFVQVLDATTADTRVELTCQISPDGLHWCDLDADGRSAVGSGLVSWPVREFGQWLRLRGVVRGDDREAKVMISLALKS